MSARYSLINRMRIAIDIRSLMHAERTGVGEYTAQFIQALLAESNKNEYYFFYNACKKQHDHIPTWTDSRVHVVATRWPNKLFHLLVLFRIIALDRLIEKKENIQLDYFFSPHLHFTHIRSTPYILTIHDISFVVYKQCYTVGRRLWHWLVASKRHIQKATYILTPSHSTKIDVVRHYHMPPEKVIVAHPGLAADWRASFPDQTADAILREYKIGSPYIFYLGTLEPRKNISMVIRAFANSSLAKRGYTLVLAGAKGWKYRGIFKDIKKYSFVRYIGYIPKEHKAVLMARARAFVYPSLYEGFGFPILEARSVETPVITSNRSSLPEVSEGQCILVHPDSCDDILQALEDVATPPYQRHPFRTEYSWQKTATLFLSLLERSRI